MLESFANFVGAVVGKQYVDQIALVLKEELISCDITNHPYGFLVFSFPTLVNGHKVRIHLWRPDARRKQLPDWPVHSHNSDLHSYVIQGVVENRECDWVEENEGLLSLYVVRYSGQKSLLSRTKSRGRLENFKNKNIVEGGSYFLEKNKFHESFVSIDDTVFTLVLFSDDRQGDAYVVGTSDGNLQYTFSRNLLEKEKAAIQRYREHCEMILRRIY